MNTVASGVFSIVGETKGSTEMINVYDFCGACADGTTVKLSFFDVATDAFVSSVILIDAKKGCKTLSAICGYSYVEFFYIGGDMLCAKVRVHKCDL